MYWSEEPWGSYRDNLHVSLLLSELMGVAAAFVGDKHFRKPDLSAFMFETAQERADRKEREALQFKLRAQALARIASKKPKPKVRSRHRG